MAFQDINTMQLISEAVVQEDWEKLYSNAEKFLRDFMNARLQKNTQLDLESLYIQYTRKYGSPCSCSVIHALITRDYSLHDLVIQCMYQYLSAEVLRYLIVSLKDVVVKRS